MKLIKNWLKSRLKTQGKTVFVELTERALNKE